MTTTQKIIFTPEAPQDTTASASQNRELKDISTNPYYEAHNDAAGAHTPGPWEVTQNYKGGIPLSVKRVGENCTVARVDWLPDGSGKPSAVCQANARLIAAAPETADERDRLKAENKRLTREREAGWGSVTTERDQAREQVKTLLAACKGVRDGWERNLTEPMRILNAAIKSVESEEQ